MMWRGGGRGGGRGRRRVVTMVDRLVGPLEGLRVVELSSELGRFAGKLLAESGASVARIGRPSSGPAMRDAGPAARGGLLDWWTEGAKRWVDADLGTAAGVATYRRLAERAD